MHDEESFFIEKFLYSNPDTLVQKNGLRDVYGIWFDQSAELQLAQISGWLRGLKDSRNEKASQFVESALLSLKRVFAKYRQDPHVTDQVMVTGDGKIWGEDEFEEAFSKGGSFHPVTLVRYYSDFSFAGFGFTILNITDKPDVTSWRYGKAHYSTDISGGLLYHGPGSGEVFSVLLEDAPTLWAYHT